MDYLRRWTQRTELTAAAAAMARPRRRQVFHQWKERYGKAIENNAAVPRDHWLTDDEKAAILAFHERHPLEGYRRLAFMMLDQDVAAASPSSVYRVLKAAGRLDRRSWAPSRKGTGFVQPLAPISTGASISPISTWPARSSTCALCSTVTVATPGRRIERC